MPYLWTDQTTIQSYLDVDGTIQIRDDDVAEVNDVVKNFSMAAAQFMENESVFEVATLLSMAFTPDTSRADLIGGETEEDIDTSVSGETPLGFKTRDDSVNSGTVCPLYLSLLVAKMTASKIATVRLGSSLSTLPNWVRAYKNETYSQIQRLVVNAETAGVRGLTLRTDYDLADILIKMKTREHTAEELDD